MNLKPLELTGTARLAKKLWVEHRPNFLPKGRFEHALISFIVGFSGCMGATGFLLAVIRPSLQSFVISVLMIVGSGFLGRATFQLIKADPRRKWVLVSATSFGFGYALLIMSSAAAPILHIIVYASGVYVGLATVFVGGSVAFSMVLLDKRLDGFLNANDDRVGKFVNSLRARHVVLFAVAGAVTGMLVFSGHGIAMDRFESGETWVYFGPFLASVCGAHLIVRVLATGGFSDGLKLAVLCGIVAGLHFVSSYIDNSDFDRFVPWLLVFALGSARQNGAALFMKELQDNASASTGKHDPNMGYL